MESVQKKVTVFTDHKCIGDLLKATTMKSTSLVRQNQRLVRACLFLNQYSFDLRYVPGHLNFLADALSRLDRNDSGDFAEDNVLDRGTKFTDLTIESGPAPSGVTIDAAESILDNFWVDLLDAEIPLPVAFN
ncbi:hypothetical protein BJ508DRAFT_336051 [Ascobolus immersus RN42]|uniref:Reverse transcriptase RNase H-like domain-containing protein n=1 Tax=Ascobolus immersus RN42 TaxID=1160509 RepID=A0A3N4HCH8_ASCIM|nr:hypothetical protein BJ508DRAFT_336051 [Ascobolus immersus RN42]